MAMQAEYTDTFGGEANYCWVKHCHFLAGHGLSDRQIVRKVKAHWGLTGHKCDVEYNWGGDTIRIIPRKMCRVIFIQFCEEHNVMGERLT